MSVGILLSAKGQIPSQPDVKRTVCGFIFNVAVTETPGIGIQADSELAAYIDAGIIIILHIMLEPDTGEGIFYPGDTAVFEQDLRRFFCASDVPERSVQDHGAFRLGLFNRDVDFNAGGRIPLSVLGYTVEESGNPVCFVYAQICSGRRCYMDRSTVAEIFHDHVSHKAAFLCIHGHEIILQHGPSVVGR